MATAIAYVGCIGPTPSLKPSKKGLFSDNIILLTHGVVRAKNSPDCRKRTGDHVCTRSTLCVQKFNNKKTFTGQRCSTAGASTIIVDFVKCRFETILTIVTDKYE